MKAPGVPTVSVIVFALVIAGASCTTSVYVCVAVEVPLSAVSVKV